MYNLLNGLKVVEGASFIAAPSCGLHLAQLGAEVVRFDALGGGPDAGRWPLAPNGHSLYWEGLNKGKKSLAIDLTRPEGRDLAAQLITAPGPDRGLFITNFPAAGFLSYERLKQLRPDLIVVRIMGRPDGKPEVDYTVNCAVGVPQMTGPVEGGPVNHVLPAWDLITGSYAAFALMAAERHRRETGEGQEVRIPLSDMAMATLSHLGQTAEVELSGADRPRYGNNLFGAFGRDFTTRDGQRLMLVAITPRQWTGLIGTLGVESEITRLEHATGVSFATDEGKRFEHRDQLNPLIARAVGARDSAELTAAFDAAGVCWGPYRTLREGLRNDVDFSARNPLFSTIEQASGFQYLAAGSAASFGAKERQSPVRAPRHGEHTDDVLSQSLRLSSAQIRDLRLRNIVGG